MLKKNWGLEYKTDDEIIPMLADADEELSLDIVECMYCVSDYFLNLLARSQYKSVRIDLAKDRFRELPLFVMLRLAQDEEEEVRLALFHRDSLPSEVLDILMTDSSDSVQRLAYLRCIRQLDASNVAGEISDERRELRYRLIAEGGLRTYCWLDLSERLALANDAAKWTLYDHKLMQIANDVDEVRLAFAKANRYSSWKYFLRGDFSEEMKLEMAKIPELGTPFYRDVLEFLVNGCSVDVRMALVQNLGRGLDLYDLGQVFKDTYIAALYPEFSAEFYIKVPASVWFRWSKFPDVKKVLDAFRLNKLTQVQLADLATESELFIADRAWDQL